jgi:ubiquinone/menaquinone biosynthesis C-methylase UbiE
LVVGIDVSQTMLSRGASELRRSGLRNLALVRGDAVELPFDDQVFDAACCFAALHLFADPLTALDNITRVLRPGGRVAIFTSVRRQITLPIFKPVIERTSGMRVFEAGEIAGALEQRGFKDIHERLSGMTQFVGGRLDA